jgi:transcription initiation factor TFIIIB Brf1 subunit/transcription initiation factor TFIIB
MECPKCGHENVLGDECHKCGIVVSKYLAVQARKETIEQQDKRQPIPLSAGYRAWVISRFFLLHKKLIITSLILIFSLIIIFVIRQITISIMHTSSLVRVGILIGILLGIKLVVERWIFEKQRVRRRTYYRDDYLKSDDWKRKRSLVLKRDGQRCVFCGAPASQVHHKRYAPQNIGREPIEWLVSVCDACHNRQHNK